MQRRAGSEHFVKSAELLPDAASQSHAGRGSGDMMFLADVASQKRTVSNVPRNETVALIMRSRKDVAENNPYSAIDRKSTDQLRQPVLLDLTIITRDADDLVTGMGDSHIQRS